MRKSILRILGAVLILGLMSVANIGAEGAQTRVIMGTIQSVEENAITGEIVIYLQSGDSYPVATMARIYDNLDSWPVPYPGRITLITNEDGISMVTDIEPRDG